MAAAYHVPRITRMGALVGDPLKMFLAASVALTGRLDDDLATGDRG